MHDTNFLSQTVLLFGAAIVVAWLFGRPRRAPSDETAEGARS